MREGAGARRLAEVRCRAGVQLLVVQSLGGVYSAHSSRLPTRALAALLDILQRVGAHARGANTDLKLRQVLAYAQSTDKVRMGGCVWGCSSGIGCLPRRLCCTC